MELRHLRYFVAVAEEGSLKMAAERRLHTSQPSLSRQIRDLEWEVGAQLLQRGPKGIALTPAGMAFLDHARLALAQAEAAADSARRTAHPAKPVLRVGFLTGHEVDCIPATLKVLQDDLPGLEIRIFSGFSVDLAAGLLCGKLDLAFVRHEPMPELEFRFVLREAVVAILPRAHRLAACTAIDPCALSGSPYIGISSVPRILRSVVNGYLDQSGARVRPQMEIDNYAMAISLVGAMDGMALLPASIDGYLPPSIVSRKLEGVQPEIDLMLAFHKANRSPVVKKFLSRLGELAGHIRGGPIGNGRVAMPMGTAWMSGNS